MTTMQQSDELEALLRGLPPDLAQRVRALDGLDGLLEIVMDLGRLPEARFAGREEILRRHEVSAEDIAYVISHIGQFGGDNRAGIERTLHRISALRNRAGKVVGLTLRVGRAVLGVDRSDETLRLVVGGARRGEHRGKRKQNDCGPGGPPSLHRTLLMHRRSRR